MHTQPMVQLVKSQGHAPARAGSEITAEADQREGAHVGGMGSCLLSASLPWEVFHKTQHFPSERETNSLPASHCTFHGAICPEGP